MANSREGISEVLAALLAEALAKAKGEAPAAVHRGAVTGSRIVLCCQPRLDPGTPAPAPARPAASRRAPLSGVTAAARAEGSHRSSRGYRRRCRDANFGARKPLSRALAFLQIRHLRIGSS